MIKLAIVGVGKIVRDQHLPSIHNTQLFEVTATASRNAQLDDVPGYADIESMLAGQETIDAVALCMPPQYRFEAGCAAIDHGCHVLLEKPPGATLNEVNHLIKRAAAKGVSLYATWHSRHAPAVAHCKQLLSKSNITSAELTWIEDVRKWHPGQAWIWQAGGLGVFDPGINGLSILSEVLSDDLLITESKLETPSNKQTPIAAHLNILATSGFNVDTKMDWRVPAGAENTECWQMSFETDQGKVALVEGGSVCLINDQIVFQDKDASRYVEYEAIYREFADLIKTNKSSVDLVPLQLVADSFMLGNVTLTEPFEV